MIVSALRPTISSGRPRPTRRGRRCAATPPPATVGPLTRISPSSASSTLRAEQRDAVRRDLRARLGQAVGRRDRDAGLARALEQRRRDRRAAEQRPAQRRRLAQAGVEQPLERRRDERDDRRVVEAEQDGLGVPALVQQHGRAGDDAAQRGSTGRRRGSAAARTASARPAGGRARPPTRARSTASCRRSARPPSARRRPARLTTIASRRGRARAAPVARRRVVPAAPGRRPRQRAGRRGA